MAMIIQCDVCGKQITKWSYYVDPERSREARFHVDLEDAIIDIRVEHKRGDLCNACGAKIFLKNLEGTRQVFERWRDEDA